MERFGRDLISLLARVSASPAARLDELLAI
jgi:hypothetical protein